jgi:hypothetical protein
VATCLALLYSGCLSAPPSLAYEQTYLRASHNWAFRRHYPSADRLFNAFDYGHAVLAERLYTRPNESPRVLEEREFTFITRRLLARPPALPLESHALAPRFTRLVPELDDLFEWAHMLHRQVYDIWADDRIVESQKDARITEVLRYYRSRSDLALSTRPKHMSLMEGQPYSGAFRERNPGFNALIWSYHWLQLAVNEGLLAGARRREQVDTAVARFRAMLTCGQRGLPTTMPMSPGVAPAFTDRYPDLSALFDNLHALHDVVSDILASPAIPRAEKRPALLRAAAAYRDSTTAVVTAGEWHAMSRQMSEPYRGCSRPPRTERRQEVERASAEGDDLRGDGAAAPPRP